MNRPGLKGVGEGGSGCEEGRQGEARRSFDLPFDGKEEKVVINSPLFIPPPHSFFLHHFLPPPPSPYQRGRA